MGLQDVLEQDNSPSTEKKIYKLDTEDEKLGKEISVMQKKLLLKELKKQYGSGWSQILKVKLGDLLKMSPERVEAVYGIRVSR